MVAAADHARHVQVGHVECMQLQNSICWAIPSHQAKQWQLEAMEKTKCDTMAEELRGSKESHYEDTERLEGTMVQGTSV